MPTPHIQAQPGEIAPTVLMPGDPLRARMIAERYLEAPRQINAVRNMLGFSGHYQGLPVTVMGSGMGIPSLSIYATELFQQYGVERIIRVGSCGALQPQLKLHDIVVALGAGTDSQVNRLRLGGYDFPAIASYALVAAVMHSAARQGIAVHAGSCFSTDLFYHPDEQLVPRLTAHGVLAIEMEAAGLYGAAAACGKQALTVLTVSDHLLRPTEQLDSQAREQSLGQMIELVLGSLKEVAGA